MNTDEIKKADLIADRVVAKLLDKLFKLLLFLAGIVFVLAWVL